MSDQESTLDTSAPGLLLVYGRYGSGVSSELEALRERASADRPVLWLKAKPQDLQMPCSALYRLVSATARTGSTASSRTAEARRAILALIAKLSGRPRPAFAGLSRLVAPVWAFLQGFAPFTIVIDDAQWLDDYTMLLGERLLPRFAKADCRVVAGVHAETVPRRRPLRSWSRLRAEGIASALVLRPLGLARTAELVRQALDAQPHPTLVDAMWRASRGNPTALDAAVTGYRAAGSITVTDRHAYLTSVNELPVGLPPHSLLNPLRHNDPAAFSVLKALSVVVGLGASAGELIAEALSRSPAMVSSSLASLAAGKVIRPLPAGGWAFSIPVVRELLRAELCPYERRRLAALAVTALWQGSATAPDDYYLADRLTEAIGLVDNRRSTRTLLRVASAALGEGRNRQAHWLRVVVDRGGRPKARAIAAATLSLTQLSTMTVDEAVHTSAQVGAVLREHHTDVAPELLQDLHIGYVTALAAAERSDELATLHATDGARLPGSPAHRLVTNAVIAMALGEWKRGARLLRDNERLWRSANPATVNHAELHLAKADLLIGNPSTMDFSMDRSAARPEHQYYVDSHRVELLLLRGELAAAQDLLRAHSISVHGLPLVSRFSLRWLAGDWDDAVHLARQAMAGRRCASQLPSRPAMLDSAARILISRGWLAKAHTLVRSNHAGGPLSHLLNLAECRALRTMDRVREAHVLTVTAISDAAKTGFLFGTGELWADLARDARAGQSGQEVARCLEQTHDAARRLGTAHAKINHLVAVAQTTGSHGAGEEALEIARRSPEKPYELATTILRIAESGIRPAELLPEAYELFGGLGALFWRARTRQLMREHGVSVPGRETTMRENERLLALLVSQGLTNKQVANVFSTTEKSVEARLTRLFSRIGYRSRVELATAMVTGQFPD